MDLYLNYEKNTQTIHDDFGRDGPYTGSYEYRSTYDDFSLTTKEGRKWDYSDYYTDEDIKVGDEVYVVFATYSTGDTFGRHEGGGIEAVFMSKNEKDANTVYNTLMRAGSTAFSVDIGLGDRTVSIYCPWSGYFESLDDLHYSVFTLEN